jgi:hypothetical protein
MPSALPDFVLNAAASSIRHGANETLENLLEIGQILANEDCQNHS